MKTCQRGGQAVDMLRRNPAARQLPVHQCVGGEAAHFHGVFDRVAGTARLRVFRCAGDRNYLEINSGCEAAVET